MVKERSENIDEVKIAGITQADDKNMFKNICNSWALYLVLFPVIFTINIWVGIYFIYYKYINRDKEIVSRYDYVYPTSNY